MSKCETAMSWCKCITVISLLQVHSVHLLWQDGSKFSYVSSKCARQAACYSILARSWCPPWTTTHFTVNHCRNFVDPVTGACTNRVEGMWSVAKSKHRRRWGVSRAMIDSYMCEFMWRARWGGNDPFSAIMNDIALLNPPQWLYVRVQLVL